MCKSSARSQAGQRALQGDEHAGGKSEQGNVDVADVDLFKFAVESLSKCLLSKSVRLVLIG